MMNEQGSKIRFSVLILTLLGLLISNIMMAFLIVVIAAGSDVSRSPSPNPHHPTNWGFVALLFLPTIYATVGALVVGTVGKLNLDWFKYYLLYGAGSLIILFIIGYWLIAC
jgi:hypothetical protein